MSTLNEDKRFIESFFDSLPREARAAFSIAIHQILESGKGDERGFDFRGLSWDETCLYLSKEVEAAGGVDVVLSAEHWRAKGYEI